MLDTRAGHKDRSWHVITVGEIMFRNHWRGFLVISVCVWIFFFKLAQGLNSVIGDDDHVCTVVQVLQNGSQHFIEGNVLIGESIHPHVVYFGVVASVEGTNRIQPVAGTVLARLNEKGE